jgi:hypothetical protein
MITPNGLNPLVMDIAVENTHDTVRMGGEEFKFGRPANIKIKLRTSRPMQIAKKYPPLIDIQAGGRRADIHGIFATNLTREWIPADSVSEHYYYYDCIAEHLAWLPI